MVRGILAFNCVVLSANRWVSLAVVCIHTVVHGHSWLTMSETNNFGLRNKMKTKQCSSIQKAKTKSLKDDSAI